MAEKKDWKLAHVAQGESDAMVIVSVLESNGIEVREARESIGRLNVIHVDGLGRVEIYVPADKYEEAIELLK